MSGSACWIWPNSREIFLPPSPVLSQPFSRMGTARKAQGQLGEAQGSAGIASPLDASTDLHRLFILTWLNSKRQNATPSWWQYSKMAERLKSGSSPTSCPQPHQQWQGPAGPSSGSEEHNGLGCSALAWGTRSPRLLQQLTSQRETMFSIDLVKHGANLVIAMFIPLSGTECFENESKIIRTSLKIFKWLKHLKITSDVGTGGGTRRLACGCAYTLCQNPAPFSRP